MCHIRTENPMPIIKNHAEREAREHLVRGMIDAGKSQNEIARHLGVTPQSVHKFLKTRGWKTIAMIEMAKEREFQALLDAAPAGAAE